MSLFPNVDARPVAVLPAAVAPEPVLVVEADERTLAVALGAAPGLRAVSHRLVEVLASSSVAVVDPGHRCLPVRGLYRDESVRPQVVTAPALPPASTTGDETSPPKEGG